MTNDVRFTGEILPRDYGLAVYPMDGPKIFISPLEYVIGKLILEEPEEIDERVEEHAERTDQVAGRVKRELVKGMRRNHDSMLLQTGGRFALNDVVREDGWRYLARVASKSERDTFWKVHLEVPSVWRDGQFMYKDVRSEADGGWWEREKAPMTMDAFCAALEIALYLDRKGRKSIDDSITGLPPRERSKFPSMPFNFFEGRQPGNDQLLTEAMIALYVDKLNHMQVSMDLLDHPELYGRSLVATFENGRATYKVLRQREKRIRKDRLDPKQDRWYGAVRAMSMRVDEFLRDRGFRRDGYVLEHKGSPFEGIARRYVKKDEAVSVCVRDKLPPYVVRRHLGERVDNWQEARDSSVVDPFAHVGSAHSTIDDATRRESVTRIYLPGQGHLRNIEVPRVLERRYEELKRDANPTPVLVS